MNLRNRRPPVRQGRPPTMRKRMAMSVRGAQYSPSLDQWIGFLFDGLTVTVFEGRTNRDRALEDARNHYDRVFHAEKPKRRWSPSTART